MRGLPPYAPGIRYPSRRRRRRPDPSAAGPAGMGRNSVAAAARRPRRAARTPLVGRHLLPVLQLMQDVGESLGVHQAVLDGHVQELLRNVVQQLVDDFARALLVALHLGEGGPIRRAGRWATRPAADRCRRRTGGRTPGGTPGRPGRSARSGSSRRRPRAPGKR